MGNKQNPPNSSPSSISSAPSLPPQSPLSPSLTYISTEPSTLFTRAQLLPHIKTIMSHLRYRDPIQKNPQTNTITINPSYLKWVFSSWFPNQMNKCIQLLVVVLEELAKKSLVWIKIEEILDVLALVQFILYFGDGKILGVFDSVLVRSDIGQAERKVIRELQKQYGELQANGNIVEKMNQEEKNIVEKCIRVTLMNFINLRQQPLSRSQTTLKYFSYLQQALFILYLKLYFSHPSTQTPSLTQLSQHYKSNLSIGAYFLSTGISYNLSPIYQSSILFLYSFLKIPTLQLKQTRRLPQHMFKNLPIISTTSLYQYIICNVLYSLKYIKEGKGVFLRFAFNRIFALKMLAVMMGRVGKIGEGGDRSVRYYLEELCLQVKAGQIQRAYVAEIVELYMKNNGTEADKQGIFGKFLEGANLKYNLKFKDQNIKISKQQLLTQLQDTQDSCKKQYELVCYKFILQRILGRIVRYDFNDKLLWQEILPGIKYGKEDEKVSQQMMDSDREEQIEEGRKSVGLGIEGGRKQEHVSVLQKGEHEEHVQ